MTTRRQFIAQIAAAPGIFATAPAWAAEPAIAAPASRLHHPGKVKSVIFYYCKGGPTQAHTFDRPRKIGNPDLHPWRFDRCGNSGLEISELFPHLRKHADDLCVIRSGYGALATHHEGGIHIFTAASRLGASLGAWMLYGMGSGNPALPGHLVLTGRAPGDNWAKTDGEINGGERAIGAGGLPPNLQAQMIRNLEKPVSHLQSPLVDDDQQRWLDELARLNAPFGRRHEAVPDLAARMASFREAYLMQTAAPEAFDLAREMADPRVRELYGLDPQPTRSTGTKLLLARRLVERGVRFVVVPSMSVTGTGGVSGDWDTHTPSQLLGLVPNLATACDLPLAGLIADLKQRGLFDQTLVVWGGEMGRGGEGHMNHNGSAFSWWMAGGSVRGGLAYGATDEQGFTAVEKPVHVRDLHATILWLCGLDHRRLNYNGTGFETTCQVVHDVLA